VNDAREEARSTLANANSLIENTLREIRSGAANDAVREMRRTIDEARARMAPVAATPGDQADGFKKGDQVRMRGGLQIGELEFDRDKKGNVVVMFGNLRMRSHIDDLEPVARGEAKRERASGT